LVSHYIIVYPVSVPLDLCLLGCIFHITDYLDDPGFVPSVPKWVKLICKYGGEVEPAYHPRITHLLCINQESALSQQALREGKRLVTNYWLFDILAKKKRLPPWKALHFPLPAK
jgi:PAX-interacting protein 1